MVTDLTYTDASWTELGVVTEYELDMAWGIDENDFDDFSSDIETLAGLLLEINGEIPKPHDKIKYKKYDFEIEKADDRHIESVMLTITPDKNEDNEEDKK